ncbi:unnamed protein product, partial [Mycena citricolor]
MSPCGNGTTLHTLFSSAKLWHILHRTGFGGPGSLGSGLGGNSSSAGSPAATHWSFSWCSSSARHSPSGCSFGASVIGLTQRTSLASIRRRIPAVTSSSTCVVRNCSCGGDIGLWLMTFVPKSWPSGTRGEYFRPWTTLTSLTDSANTSANSAISASACLRCSAATSG